MELQSSTEDERQAFAAEVVAIALASRSNSELLTNLRARYGEDYFQLVGQGSTRTVYGCPLGLAIKVQRESTLQDPLDDAETAQRASDAQMTIGEYALLLEWRRRTANLNELTFATLLPRLMPTQYAFLGSFGLLPKNPSILIAELCRPLTHFDHLKDETEGIDCTNMGLDADGRLWVFDPRITPTPRPDSLQKFEELAVHERRIWLGNIGATTSGTFALLDRSDHGRPENLLNPLTMMPRSHGFDGWDFSITQEQVLSLSRDIFSMYEQGLNQSNGKKE